MISNFCRIKSSRKNVSFALNLHHIMSIKSCNNKPLISDFKDFQFSYSKLQDLKTEINSENYVRRFIKEDVLVDILDLDPKVVEDETFVQFISGNVVLPSSTPLAHRYGGYQFGVWASQLGDGRAILLGEVLNGKNERWELQLKGSGKTPYSREGDGRAVLRSSIREFLCSEFMHYLGIPTTRAGAIIVSDDMVVRDLLYDGHPQLEACAVVLRVAKSWFRFGSLEILSKYGDVELMKTLLHFIIQEHFPEIEKDSDIFLNFLINVYHITCDLVVKWHSVGFTHGVLNTDNMSLLGLTIDYGPFGFMEEYDVKYVPNHSDSEGRYSYGCQINVILFNLLLLTKSLSCLLTREQLTIATNELQCKAGNMDAKIIEKFSWKLGINLSQPLLVSTLLAMFKETKADFTMVFRQLSENPLPLLLKPSSNLWALKKLSNHAEYVSFIQKYSEELSKQGTSDEDRIRTMCERNPCYILRNWMGEKVIRKATSGDYSEVNLLLKILRNPFLRQEEAEHRGYAAEPPSWSKSLCMSCSS